MVTPRRLPDAGLAKKIEHEALADELRRLWRRSSELEEQIAGTGGGITKIYDATDTNFTADPPAVGRFLVSNGTAVVDRLLLVGDLPSHTHVEADITDLGNYSLVGHTHVEADITDLGNYSLVGHTHVEADITDLGNYSLVGHVHSAAEITSGILAVDRGGTGLNATNLTAGDLIHSPDGSSYGGFGIGTLGQILKVAAGPVLSWGSVDWTEVANKPSTFPPDSHTLDSHTGTLSLTKIALLGDGAFIVGSGGGNTSRALLATDLPTHTHVASQITDFNSAVDARLDTAQTITNLWTFSAGIRSSGGHLRIDVDRIFFDKKATPKLVHHGDVGTNQTVPWDDADIHVYSVTANITITVNGAESDTGDTVSLWIYNSSGVSRTVTLSGVDILGGSLTSSLVIASGNASIIQLQVGRNEANTANRILAMPSPLDTPVTA